MQNSQGLEPDGFKLQLKALQNLVHAKANCHPSVMVSFSPKSAIQTLIQRLKQVNSSLAEELEIEELIVHPGVVRKMQRHKLRHYTGCMPENVPSEQI